MLLLLSVYGVDRKIKTATPGERVVFKCNSKGESIRSKTWHSEDYAGKEHSAVKYNARIQRLPNGDLRIKDVRRSDGKDYICTLFLPGYKTASEVFRLSVQGKLVYHQIICLSQHYISYNDNNNNNSNYGNSKVEEDPPLEETWP